MRVYALRIMCRVTLGGEVYTERHVLLHPVASQQALHHAPTHIAADDLTFVYCWHLLTKQV